MANRADALFVRVNDHLMLSAGRVSAAVDKGTGQTVYTVGKPKTPMLDQVLAYLQDMPDQWAATGMQSRYLGLGLAALAVRWSTYLATLMDPATPFHDSIPTDARQRQPDDISYLDQTEMKRLNIEVSYNLARLGQLYRASHIQFHSLLGKACVYLPYPVSTVKPDQELHRGLSRALLAGSVAVRMARDPEQAAAWSRATGISIDTQNLRIREIESADPDRIIANYLAQAAWRNTVIEDYHAGHWPDPPLLPHQRRFSQADEKLLLRAIGNNMAVLVRWMVTFFDPTPFDLGTGKSNVVLYPETATALYNVSPLAFHDYPYDWTVSETSSVVKL